MKFQHLIASWRGLWCAMIFSWAISTAAAQTVPTLNIAPVGSNLQVSWPTNSGNWNLCTRSDLVSGDWSLVTTAPAVSNGQNVVTVPKAGAAQYFQLRHQGAVVPFLTYEAEAATNTTTGTVVTMTTKPTVTTWTPELEASGRAYVLLSATGQHLDIPVTQVANALVIRHCIPDAPLGGGITATLSVYVNGVFRQKLSLSSTYNWLYGDGKNDLTYNGQSNDPTITGATPHVFWDETRAFITGGVQAGDVLRFEMDSDDTAAYYRIDLVDLEQVPAPLSPPAAGTYLSITDYGANGTDTTDDTTAIQNCITAAKAQGKIVWMPAGTYYQSANFVLNGVTVQGAGMWYTNLISTVTNSSFAGTVGFTLQGSNTHVSDMHVESCTAHTTRNTTGGRPFTSSSTSNLVSNWSVENVWITHTITGFWMSGATNGDISGCRVRCTYADGINLNLGASNNIVENNHVRGSGDDGIAILSEATTMPVSAVSMNNTQRFNTVIATWWGHNCDLAGGSGHLVEDNYLADNWGFGGIGLNSPSGTYAMYALSNCTVARNTIVRGGGNASNQQRGAIWIYPDSATFTGVTIRDNLISYSIFRGIHLVPTPYTQQITFTNNVIDHPGDIGVLIQGSTLGSGIFNYNTVTNPAPSFAAFTNSSTSYTVTGTGNSWQ